MKPYDKALLKINGWEHIVTLLAPTVGGDKWYVENSSFNHKYLVKEEDLTCIPQ